MKALTTLLFISISFRVFAQKDSSYYNPNITRKVFYLKPLQKVNGNYFYGERKLKDFYALEVPFFELNDAEVNQHYKQYKNFKVAQQFISFIPSIYLLASLQSQHIRQSGYNMDQLSYHQFWLFRS